MNNSIALLLLTITLSFTSCTNSQPSETNLDAKTFAQKIEELDNETIIDVRTPGEYSEGHIENALNINWNDPNFTKEIQKLDKTKPLMVYCLSGGRSSSAASKLRNEGFTNVIELNGGMMQWRNNNLPETNQLTKNNKEEMSVEDFKKTVNSEKYVLVDFYAEWCAPCKKMKPSLDEISKEYTENVTVIRIDVDKNPTIAKAMNIEGLPTLHLYKKSDLVWQKLGYVTKEEMTAQFK
jgi:thioredoxin 1